MNDKRIWTSARGYSKPGEIVTVVETCPRTGMVRIQSDPDGIEELAVSPGGFSYWVPPLELAEVR